MSTLTCKGCGWVYPPDTTRRRCRFCGTEFDESTCKICGKFGKLFPKLTICRECYNRHLRESGTASRLYAKKITKYIKNVEDRYTAWLDLINKIPKPYKFLTETQWLEACRFFNGCALCNNKEVTTRGFFIQHSAGGKYCDWNTLPLCEQCATRLNIQPNPFKRMDKILNRTVNTERGMSKEKVEAAALYLSSKMEVLIRG